MVAKQVRLAIAEFSRNPVLRLPIHCAQVPLLRGDTWGNNPLWPVFDWAARNEGSVRERLRRLAAERCCRPDHFRIASEVIQM
jgi:hypothetical protein